MRQARLFVLATASPLRVATGENARWWLEISFSPLACHHE
jgi:hypothetical protein